MLKQKKQKDEKSALLTYVSILFAAAFLLVLFSYLLATRNSDQRITELRDFQSAIDSLQGEIKTLQDKNSALNSEIAALQLELDDESRQKGAAIESMQGLDSTLKDKDGRIYELMNENARLEKEAASLEAEILSLESLSERQSEFFNLLWRANSYFEAGRYDECRELYISMKDLNPLDLLQTGTDGDSSPAAAYWKIAGYFEE